MKTQISPKLERAVSIRLGMCAAALGGTAVITPEANAQITTFTTPIPIPQTTAGVYINLLTGATGTSGGSVSGWDFNPYNAAVGTQLGFYWQPTPNTPRAAGVASTATGPYLGLNDGDVVSSSSTFTSAITATTGSPFLTSGTFILGFRFFNEGTATTNFGYASITTNAGTGFPAVINSWSFETNGGPITVSTVPEPTSLMLTGVAMAAGARGIRKWRRQRAA